MRISQWCAAARYHSNETRLPFVLDQAPVHAVQTRVLHGQLMLWWTAPDTKERNKDLAHADTNVKCSILVAMIN